MIATMVVRVCRMLFRTVSTAGRKGGIFTFIQVTAEGPWVFLQDLARPDNTSDTSTASPLTLPPASIRA
jgi:hypothetical protein